MPPSPTRLEKILGKGLPATTRSGEGFWVRSAPKTQSLVQHSGSCCPLAFASSSCCRDEGVSREAFFEDALGGMIVESSQLIPRGGTTTPCGVRAQGYVASVDLMVLHRYSGAAWAWQELTDLRGRPLAALLKDRRGRISLRTDRQSRGAIG